MSPGSPPAASVTRRVEWVDTDAAGRFHHSTVIRWVEDAEAELLESLGVLDLFGAVPRVRYEVDYRSPVFFRDLVRTTLRVSALGRTSVRYEFEVHCVNAGVATDAPVVATGSVVAVLVDANGRPRDWPADARSRLSS
jgi:YbgC/YbaW family acyl-CoA thioester hydrolase